MTDYKALCAELLAAADEYAGMNPYMRLDNAMKAARAALAEPEPVGPTQDEIMSLAYEYFTFRGNSHRDSFFATSIEAKKDPCASLDDFARAVLDRWGQQ